LVVYINMNNQYNELTVGKLDEILLEMLEYAALNNKYDITKDGYIGDGLYSLGGMAVTGKRGWDHFNTEFNRLIKEQYNIMEEDYSKYFVCYKNILTEEKDEKGNPLALTAEIVGENPKRTFDIIMQYIKDNPDCNIYAWGQTGITNYEFSGENEECSTEVQSTYAIEEIKRERLEQINKHGFNVDSDMFYGAELLDAAIYCINSDISSWPETLDSAFKDKIDTKSRIQKLVVSAAFIAAEIDRIKSVEILKEKLSKYPPLEQEFIGHGIDGISSDRIGIAIEENEDRNI